MQKKKKAYPVTLNPPVLQTTRAGRAALPTVHCGPSHAVSTLSPDCVHPAKQAVRATPWQAETQTASQSTDCAVHTSPDPQRAHLPACPLL